MTQELPLFTTPDRTGAQLIDTRTRCEQRQFELLPATLFQDVTGQILFADAMRNDHDATLFRVVQTSLNLIVEELVHTLEPLGVITVFNLDRVIDDDKVGAKTRDPALD